MNNVPHGDSSPKASRVVTSPVSAPAGGEKKPAPSGQPVGDRIPHTTLIDELMGKDVARLLDPAERAVELHDHIRNFAHLYGLEALHKAIKTGLAFYKWDKVSEASRLDNEARERIWRDLEGQL